MKILFCLVATVSIFTATGVMAVPSLVVSVPDQTLAVIDGGVVVEKFPVSTSRFGLGDSPNSYATPLGSLEIASKIGGNAPLGAVFKSRKPTGKILKPNAAGRDPMAPKAPTAPVRAKNIIWCFMDGAPSSMDTFDPKPLLDKLAWQPVPPS